MIWPASQLTVYRAPSLPCVGRLLSGVFSGKAVESPV
jgi:hypothetical protein